MRVALTELTDGWLREQFDAKQLVTLVFRIMVINAWNRANITFHTPPGALDKTYGLDKAGLN